MRTLERPNLRLYDAARSSTVVPSSNSLRDRGSAADADWPGAVELILSALEVASALKTREQRNFGRRRYRVRAALRLHSDPDGAPAWILYTRDANARGLGFLTPHLLPLGYGGVIHLESPARQHVSVACTLLRCREISKGWYEGSLCFNRERNDFVVAG